MPFVETRPHLEILRFPHGLNHADLSDREISEMMKDGRFAAPICEKMCCKLFPGFVKHRKQVKGSDDVYNGEMAEVKTLTETTGVRFQLSKNIGVGRRSPSTDDFYECIHSKKHYFIFDITKPKDIWAIKLSSDVIANWLFEVNLGASGLKCNKF